MCNFYFPFFQYQWMKFTFLQSFTCLQIDCLSIINNDLWQILALIIHFTSRFLTGALFKLLNQLWRDFLVDCLAFGFLSLFPPAAQRCISAQHKLDKTSIPAWSLNIDRPRSITSSQLRLWSLSHFFESFLNPNCVAWPLDGRRLFKTVWSYRQIPRHFNLDQLRQLIIKDLLGLLDISGANRPYPPTILVTDQDKTVRVPSEGLVVNQRDQTGQKKKKWSSQFPLTLTGPVSISSSSWQDENIFSCITLTSISCPCCHSMAEPHPH